MTDDSSKPAVPKPENGQPRGFLRRNLHFLLAVVILVLTWTAITLLGWVEKLPVPWPAGNEVNEQFRLVKGLAKQFGHFMRVERDGVFGKPDGKPDGEMIIPDEIMEPLGIGKSSADIRRRPKRRSNWYVSRIYRDTRIRNADRNPYAYWRLAVYYYTGKRDVVPHVADVCQLAAGAQELSMREVTMNIPAARDPWKKVTFRRGIFERTDPMTGVKQRSIVYYVFSLNGKPVDDRNMVRLGIADPRVSYSYFAKIEIAPLGRLVEDPEKADKRAEEFLRSALPAVLKTLPTVQDVERLRNRKSKDEQ